MAQFEKVPCRYGAPMGRPGIADETDVKVRLFRVKMVDYDYDDGGAYWGGAPSAPLYCARDDNGMFQQFQRASSRAAAKRQLLQQFPDLKFYR